MRDTVLMSTLTLFELKDDCRPEVESTAEGRYREPTFLGPMAAVRDAASQ
jgi:hypothetical protein